MKMFNFFTPKYSLFASIEAQSEHFAPFWVQKNHKNDYFEHIYIRKLDFSALFLTPKVHFEHIYIYTKS